jgi:O-antigen biosynthesis protein
MPRRRAGAPRLIDWTGERCVPWAPDVQVVYEHFHRYLWAQRLVEGRRVLDLGSGEGFGSALLADAARTVTGIDIDERTVEHSRLNYAAPNLDFRVASATDLGDFPDDAFDAVVAFEVIEHVAEQVAALDEVARVLAPGGLLVVSTPERRAYSDATGQVNPFHERELTQEELAALLAARFGSRALFAQRTATGSRIESMDSAAAPGHLPVRLERAGDEWRPGAPPAPLYLIAVASDAALPELPAESTLSDYSLGLLREAERAVSEAHGEAEAAERRRADAEQRLAAARTAAEEEQARAESERARLARQVADRAHEAESARLQAQRAEAGAVHAVRELARVEESVTWRLFQRARGRLYGAIGGRESPAGRTLSAALRFVGRAGGRGRGGDGAAWPQLSMPRYPEPDVSIVIPVHSRAELTRRCLQAVVASSAGVSYEVIVVDDAADADTKAMLGAVDGAHVVVNEQNVGFLRSVNRGAAEARGQHIVLLNNDTEPQLGWLSALVERAECGHDVGVVAAKLVYPDGTLQEAGGIVWRGGEPWNYGRGGDAAAPEYNYVREVDYGSAAALLVRAELWRAAGGFDERFAPGYFEDTDLCFTARALGRRVLYEPRAAVIHLEGQSLGTDVSTGGKRHQELNRPKFAEKWRAALREQPPHPTPQRAHLASDRRRGPHVLIIDHRVPTPDRDSGSLRMHHVLEGLVGMGCRVTFLPDNLEPLEPYTSNLQGMGVEVLTGRVNVPERIAALGSVLRLAILSRPYVAPRYLHLVREYAPGARVAYDTVDLHFLREERRMAFDERADTRIADGFRGLELALARAADVTLVVTEEERELLERLEPGLAVAVVPNANEIARDVPGPEERAGLLFVGGFEHAPNVDAALHLAHAVMPRIWRDLPDATLTIVGGKAPPEVQALASPGIDVAGWVPDIGPLLRESHVMVAPLRYGAGMKGKVTQSLAAGLPVVTSRVGAEGLDAEDGRELLLADDTKQFADRVVQLHCDDELWCTLSANGQALVERLCSPSVQLRALERLLAEPRALREHVPGG